MPGCKLSSGINRCIEEMEKVEIEFGKLALILVGGWSLAEETLDLCYVK